MTGMPAVERRVAPDPALERVRARVRSEIAGLRLKLAVLREQVDVTRGELDGDTAASLREANECLVLAAMQAQRNADSSEAVIREMAGAAELDPLTHLPVPALLRSRLATLIANAREGQADGHGALLLVNLTDFKRISDTLGHGIGDQALQLAARTLAAVVRPIDSVSRHRGNEFLILLPQLADVAEAVVYAAKITAALGAPALVANHVLRLSASVGIAIYPEDGADADSLIDRAVAAMYRAKWRGLGSFAFQGEAGTRERSLELRTLESLRQPLVDHETAAAEAERRNALLQEANTQLLLAAVSAQELKDAADQAQRRQTNFLGQLAHELRSPLTPIRNATAILARIPSESDLLAKVQGIIERQVHTMSRLVEDLLDVARVRSGKLRLEMALVDINALVDDVVQACRPSMDSRLQLFEVRLATPAVLLRADAVRLVQVLSNLLENASKYTPEHGRIQLETQVEGNQVLVTVDDNGIGITQAALASIFEPFVQEQHATLFNGTGLGIGLTVVRELVEGHGGKITAASGGRGKGSRFSVTLPIERQTAGLP